ncbi:MAG TPA: AI-2E family transporter [Candidatus Peribacteraceae bacterium]|nr:AI-2E family transporter [Candidatus Peribacteraceae bacterium]
MPDENGSALSLQQFLWRVFLGVLITLALIVAAIFLWYTAEALLLGLAGILLAIALCGLARLVRIVLPVSRPASLAIVFLLIIGLATIAFWLLAPSAVNEAQQLTSALPKAVGELQSWIVRQPWMQQLLSFLSVNNQGTGAFDLLGQLTNIFSTTYLIVFEALIVIFMGIALAIEPRTYMDGALLLLPPVHRPRIRQILDELHVTLLRWITGQFLSMVSVGLLTFFGLLILQMPLAFSLSLIAGVLEFIPTIGPIIGVVPALLIALLKGPFTVFLVAVVYIIVHVIEGYLLMPFIHRYTVSLPPVVTVIVLVSFGFTLGPLGLLLATPITAMVLVLIKMVYLEGVLKERTVLPGEHTARRH